MKNRTRQELIDIIINGGEADDNYREFLKTLPHDQLVALAENVAWEEEQNQM